MAKAKNSAGSFATAPSSGGVNSAPAPRIIHTKQEKAVGGGRTQNLHSHTPMAVRAGKKHPAQNQGGTLSAA